MCGRVKLLSEAETQELKSQLDQIGARIKKALPYQLELPFYPSAKPTVDVRVGGSIPYFELNLENFETKTMQARWGYSAEWTTSLIFNTRIESYTKDYWKSDFQSRRAVVVCSSFYEPASSEFVLSAKGARKKRQYEYREKDERAILLAALFRGEQLSIVTRCAKGAEANIHDRMPLALTSASYKSWLLGDFANLANSYQPELIAKPEDEPQEQLSLF